MCALVTGVQTCALPIYTDLSSEQVKAVRREYFNGTAARVLKVRRALAPYVVQDLRVATDPATQRPPEFLLMVMPSEAADRKSTRLNSSHYCASRIPSSA